MTWPIALFLAVVVTIALGFVGAIAALLGERIAVAILRGWRWGLHEAADK